MLALGSLKRARPSDRWSGPDRSADLSQVSQPDRGVRRKLLRRFPYLVVFVELDTQVRVLAVAHAKRSPGCWLERI